jgi:hypothetical protein
MKYLLALVVISLAGCKTIGLEGNNRDYSIKRLQDYACSQHYGVKEYSPIDVRVVECNELNTWKRWG